MLKGQETLDKTSFIPRFVCRFFVRCTCICKRKGRRGCVCLHLNTLENSWKFSAQQSMSLLASYRRTLSRPPRLLSSRLVFFLVSSSVVCFVSLLEFFCHLCSCLRELLLKAVLLTSYLHNLINFFGKKQSQIKLIVFVIVGSKNCFNLLFIVCCYTYLFNNTQQYYLTRCIHYLF